MIAVMARKELTLLWRDGRAVTALALVLLLALASTLSSGSAISTMERERAAAVTSDRETWDNQGNKNPHTAAHFARYAFKPTYNLAVFDPGLTSFMGNAIWLEAHYRDPAALRPIEDTVELQRIADLSPAWVIQVLAPALIVVLLFGALAGERESGTLRQVMSLGVRPATLLVGKALPVFLLVALLVLAVLVGSGSLAAASGRTILALPDTWERVGGLIISYGAYVAIFVLVALSLSALCARRRSALMLLLGFWVLAVVAAPRLAADLGGAVASAPSIPEFADRLSKESSDPFWGNSEEAVALRQRVTDDLLQEHGVESAAELPVNLDGYLLQASEEYANSVFDTLYGDLWDGYERQRGVSRLLSLISPTIALQNLSMALSGSDLRAHRHFADAAEAFRREFVLLLNQEMIDHGGADGYAYVSGNDFWRQTPDFTYAPPRLVESLGGVWIDAVILLLWLAAALALAILALRRGLVREALA